jgi:hypothetical protein
VTDQERISDLEDRLNSNEQLAGSFYLLVAKYGEDLKRLESHLNEVTEITTGSINFVKDHSEQIKQLREGQTAILSILKNITKA